MTWRPFPHGFRLSSVAKRPPDALVVVLADTGSAAVTLYPIVVHWASTVPTTEFIILEGAGTRPAGFDRAEQHLEALLQQELQACRLDGSRLVLVGFGSGGTLALHLSLHEGRRVAGVLALAPKLPRARPRVGRGHLKIRLIGCAEDSHIDHHNLRDFVALLTSLEIDTRGVLLAGSVLSDEAIRHGGAYLVELVATAQRGDRLPVGRARRRAAGHHSPVME